MTLLNLAAAFAQASNKGWRFQIYPITPQGYGYVWSFGPYIKLQGNTNAADKRMALYFAMEHLNGN